MARVNPDGTITDDCPIGPKDPGMTIRPCPLCGQKAVLIDDSPARDLPYGVGCSNRKCRLFTGLGVKLHPTAKEAVAEWNRRAYLLPVGPKRLEDLSDEEIRTIAGFVASKRMPELLAAFKGFFGADHEGIRQMQAEFLAFGLAHDAILDYVRMRRICADVLSVVDEMDKLTHICDISRVKCVGWRQRLREIIKNREEKNEGK